MAVTHMETCPLPTLSVVYCPNPLRPASDRQALTVALVPGDTVQTVITRLGLASTPLAVAINGHALDAGQWATTPVAISDLLVLRQVARGLEASTMTAKLIMGAEMSYTAAAIWGTVIAFAANAAIAYALSTAAASLARKSASSAAADNSPTAYGVEGGSNSARPYEPLQLVLGEHRVYPDYACRPFAEYVPDPSTATEVINNTPAYETQTHPAFSLSGTPPAPPSPWQLIKTEFTEPVTYYWGDGAARTYTSSSDGTQIMPHTFVVRAVGAACQVATYEDYLTLTTPVGDGNGGGGE